MKLLDKLMEHIITKTLSRLNRVNFSAIFERCHTCGSGLINYEEFSPDGPKYYFCNKKCYNKWEQYKITMGIIYRALPLTKIER